MYAGRVCVRALKGLALPRAGEIALAGSRHLHSMLAVVLILLAHAIVTVAQNSTSATRTVPVQYSQKLRACGRYWQGWESTVVLYP